MLRELGLINFNQGGGIKWIYYAKMGWEARGLVKDKYLNLPDCMFIYTIGQNHNSGNTD